MGPFLFSLASLGHESGHHTASRWRFVNDLTGLLTMSLIGIPARGWKVKHDIHHQFGGVPDRDTDQEPKLEAYLSHGPLLRWVIRTSNRLQVLLWWAMPLTLWVNCWYYAARNLAARGTRYRSRTRWTIADMVVSAAFFGAAALYTATFGWANLGLLVGIPFAGAGVVGAVCFVPNHRGMPPLSEEQARRPARYTHVNSRTVLYPSLIPANYFMNYVPWQIEHHIFPTVAGFRLSRLSPHLQEYARREGIPLAYETFAEVMPRMLRREWLWGQRDGQAVHLHRGRGNSPAPGPRKQRRGPRPSRHPLNLLRAQAPGAESLAPSRRRSSQGVRPDGASRPRP